MATFAPSHSGLEDEFGQDGSLGEFSGRLGVNRSATTSFDLLMDLSPQSASLVEFNLSDGASSEQSFAFNPVGFDSFSQMSHGFVDDDVFPQPNYLLMPNTAQYLPGSNGSFAQSHTIPAMPFSQQSQAYPSQFGQQGLFPASGNQIFFFGHVLTMTSAES